MSNDTPTLTKLVEENMHDFDIAEEICIIFKDEKSWNAAHKNILDNAPYPEFTIVHCSAIFNKSNQELFPIHIIQPTPNPENGKVSLDDATTAYSTIEGTQFVGDLKDALKKFENHNVMKQILHVTKQRALLNVINNREISKKVEHKDSLYNKEKTAYAYSFNWSRV